MGVVKAEEPIRTERLKQFRDALSKGQKVYIPVSSHVN